MGRGIGTDEAIAQRETGRSHDRSHVDDVFALERTLRHWLPRRRKHRDALLAEIDLSGRLAFGLKLIEQVEKRPKTQRGQIRSELIAQIALDNILGALGELRCRNLTSKQLRGFQDLKEPLRPLLENLQRYLDRGRDNGMIAEDAFNFRFRPEHDVDHPQLDQIPLQHLDESGAVWMARAFRTLEYAAKLRQAAPAPSSGNLARMFELCEQHAAKLEELMPKLYFENGVPPGARRLETAVRFFSNAYAIVMLDDNARQLNEQLDPLFEACREATSDYLGADCPDPLLALPDADLVRALMSVNARWAPAPHETTFAFRHANGGIIVGPKTTEKALDNLKRKELSHVICHELVHSSQDLKNTSYMDFFDLMLLEGTTEWLARRISQRPTKQFRPDRSPYFAYPAWTDIVDEFSKLVAPDRQGDLVREMSQVRGGAFSEFAVSCLKHPRLMGPQELRNSSKDLQAMVFNPTLTSYTIGSFGGYREEGHEFVLRNRIGVLLEVNFPYYKEEVERRKQEIKRARLAAA